MNKDCAKSDEEECLLKTNLHSLLQYFVPSKYGIKNCKSGLFEDDISIIEASFIQLFILF